MTYIELAKAVFEFFKNRKQKKLIRLESERNKELMVEKVELNIKYIELESKLNEVAFEKELLVKKCMETNNMLFKFMTEASKSQAELKNYIARSSLSTKKLMSKIAKLESEK